MNIEAEKLVRIIEAALFAADEPLPIERLLRLFEEDDAIEAQAIKDAIAQLQEEHAQHSLELKHVASGFRFQVRQDYSPWIKKLWEMRPPRYSRALLETLALVAYRQPITRAEIEDVRGVAVSTSIIKTLLEREWVRIIGHKDVPGKPALFATTKTFLDYFDLKALSELPALADIQDLGNEKLQALMPEGIALAEALAPEQSAEQEVSDELAEQEEEPGISVQNTPEREESLAAEELPADASEQDQPEMPSDDQVYTEHQAVTTEPVATQEWAETETEEELTAELET